ncbi:nucleotidyltransferase domain-containing protein [Ectopseudomonas mendocina]|uniref:type VII toxin-antitoxin system MntA family adenylyltransferase antitoxin n=1 Tax=Ectopseudomonas mendocina TaxID=300 RepID=UPI001AE0A6DA|nr:nucleotidyltransferase domain-containing protein [Pseudomonas mendocina]QTN45088.1 nucleotidyltransferase domain-containing protein [Pseudomonas mendocina]
MSIEALATALKRHPDIRLAYVFGSLATDSAGPDSDVDVAILASSPLDIAYRIRLIEEISVATGCPVDLIDLATVGEPLLGQVLRHGIRLIGDTAQHAELTTRHVFNNEDFMPYVRRMLTERRQA